MVKIVKSGTIINLFFQFLIYKHCLQVDFIENCNLFNMYNTLFFYLMVYINVHCYYIMFTLLIQHHFVRFDNYFYLQLAGVHLSCH